MVAHLFLAKDSVSLAIQYAAFNLSISAPGPRCFFIERTARLWKAVAGDRADANHSLDPGDDVRSLEDVPSNKS